MGACIHDHHGYSSCPCVQSVGCTVACSHPGFGFGCIMYHVLRPQAAGCMRAHPMAVSSFHCVGSPPNALVQCSRECGASQSCPLLSWSSFPVSLRFHSSTREELAIRASMASIDDSYQLLVISASPLLGPRPNVIIVTTTVTRTACFPGGSSVRWRERQKCVYVAMSITIATVDWTPNDNQVLLVTWLQNADCDA